jgi:hypothetical protein
MINMKGLKKRYAQSIITAFSLVIGLIWNSAFQHYFDQQEKLKKHKYGRWIYAIIVTIVLIFIITLLSEYI